MKEGETHYDLWLRNINGQEKRVLSEDYIVVDGQHEAIVPEDLWLKTKEKRDKTKGRREKVVGIGRQHLLTGILKCLVCHSSMYSSRRGRTEADMLYYYKCGQNMKVTGHTYNYKKTAQAGRNRLIDISGCDTNDKLPAVCRGNGEKTK